MGFAMKVWLFFLLSEVIFIGCSQPASMPDPRDHPFIASSRTQVVETEILQCRSYPIECPGYLKLNELPFWPKEASSADSLALAPLGGASKRDGFPASQVRLWAQNGMQVAILSPDQLRVILRSLLQNGGTALRETAYFIRNNQEVAHFVAKWIDSPTPLFVAESSTSLRGVSLTEGSVLFRLNGQPLSGAGGQRKIHVNLVPVFQGAEQWSVFLRDSQGRPRTVSESTVVVFDKLLLSGIVEDGAVILIAPTADESPGSLGEVFLKNTDRTESSQLVLLMVPKLIKAKRTKFLP